MIDDGPTDHDLTAKLEETVNDKQPVYHSDATEKIINDYLGQKYFLANNKKALWNVMCTMACHVLAFSAYFILHSPVLFVVTYSLVTLRWFMIYHDCTHGSFWEKTKWCTRFGQLLSFIVMTPYTSWHKNHVSHHSISGDRTNKEYVYNETIYYTVREYLKLPSWKRYLYRFFREPIIYFTILPFIKFFIINRFYEGAWMTNVGTFVYCYFIYYCGGFKFLLLFLSTMMLASSVGVILFHTQHTYNPSYVNNISGQYSKFESSLRGSSYMIMPPLIKWFTMGIEYHHIHHLKTRIPGYNLEQAHKNAPAHLWEECYKFDSWNKIIDSLNKTLFDEEHDRFISFSEVQYDSKNPKIL